MTLTKYFEIGKINFINSFAYTFDLLASSVFVALILFIFVSLWKVVFGGQIMIEGFTISMMLWYLVMTESIVTAQGHVVEEIGEEIKSGQIANYLNKPYNYIFYKYASNIGNGVFRFFLTFLVASIVVLIFLGGITIPLISIIPVLITVFLAITLHFAMMALLGVFAFWFEDAKSMHFIYQKIVFTIGGMLLPLEIFPFWLERISAVLPFSYVAYHPAKLFVKFSFSSFFSVLVFQIIWIAVISLFIFLVFRVCVKKVSVNGG